MEIPLNEFEQHIDEIILNRGLSYFQDEAITDFSEISNGIYEATVSGAKEYMVQLEIQNNTIVAHNCDCPFDLGPICKHEVAVMFHLQKDELELIPSNISKSSTKKIKTESQQIKELLKAISHKELKEFIQENSKKDKKFSNYFLASFGYLSQDQSKQSYLNQIHSILQSASGRDGWIDWKSMSYVVTTTEPLLENAEKSLANNNFENVFFISSALLEEMIKALDYADDSNGNLGYFIESAMELLSKLTQENLSKKLRTELFEYCISAFNNKLFDGWQWYLETLDIASKLIENESQVDTILNCLDTVTENYYVEQAQSFKLDLLRKYKAKRK